MMETIVDIYELDGANTNRAYTKKYSAVRAWILPATNEAIALNDGMPVGQEYQFRIISSNIPNLGQQSKFVVVGSQISGFENGDEFITVAATKRARVMGKFYLVGVCYKRDDTN